MPLKMKLKKLLLLHQLRSLNLQNLLLGQGYFVQRQHLLQKQLTIGLLVVVVVGPLDELLLGATVGALDPLEMLLLDQQAVLIPSLSHKKVPETKH